MEIDKKFIFAILTILLLGIVSAECLENQIDINSASLEELDKLIGIGGTIANNIINSRPFNSVDDLIYVNRIGVITLEKIKEQGLACVKSEDIEVLNNSNNLISKEDTPVSGIEINYPKQVELNKEFIFKVKLINFSDDRYDIKIEIFEDESRIAKILNGESWKSTNYYIDDVIKNNEEKKFLMKIIIDFEEAEIRINVRDSKNKLKSFTGYTILKSDESSEENEKETKTENSEKIEFSDDETTETINLKPIVLNTQNIKSENDKEFSVKDLAFYGVIFFGVVFGALFFLNKRKYKNEFQ